MRYSLCAVLIAALAIPRVAAQSGPDEKGVIDRALAYLVKAQEADGSWPCNEAKDDLPPGFKGMGKPPERIFSTALAGLALLDYSGRDKRLVPAVQKAATCVATYVTVDYKTSTVNPTWLFAMSGMFLARAHRAAPKELTRDALTSIVRGLEDFVETTGGWGHGRVEGDGAGDALGYHDLSAAHNWVCVALDDIRKAGIEVPDRMISRAVDYYTKTQYPSGALAYNIGHRKSDADETTTLGEGRSVASLCGLVRLAPKSEATKRAAEYARKRVDAVLTHHTPWLHLVSAGWGMESLGPRDLAKFDARFRKKMFERVAADGHARSWSDGKKSDDPLDEFKAMGDRDGKIGPGYTTACFLLLARPRAHAPIIDRTRPPRAARANREEVMRLFATAVLFSCLAPQEEAPACKDKTGVAWVQPFTAALKKARESGRLLMIKPIAFGTSKDGGW